MASRKVTHLVPSKSEGWKVKNQGAPRARKCFETKASAEKWGRADAKKHSPSQLIVHDKKGRFQRESTFGNDPYPPEG